MIYGSLSLPSLKATLACLDLRRSPALARARRCAFVKALREAFVLLFKVLVACSLRYLPFRG